MHYEIEAGTDAAMLLLFDPAALPDDFDAKSKEDPVAILEEATDRGNAHLINTDGDGSYLLHVFVDEPVPAKLTGFLHDERQVPSFRIPSGKLYFSGAEYGFQHDDSFLRKHPHMGGFIDIVPGTYHLSLFRTEYPEGMQENKLRRQLPNMTFRLHQLMGAFVVLALLGIGIIAFSLFQPTLRPLLIPLGICFLAVPFIVSRLPAYRKARGIRKAIARQYPSVVARLTLADGQS